MALATTEDQKPSTDSGEKPARRIEDDFIVLAEGDEEQDEMFPEDFEDYYPLGMLEQVNDRTFELQSKREDVRGRLAIIYTVATFGVFVMGFIVAILDAVLNKTSIIEGLTTLLPLISGIFLGSLGFVLGYYFRQAEGENGKDDGNNHS